ncbi:simple sugar transport system substrate-binding protein [Spinactinospora alkalitolerans]|uniref:Simple sugar transport system substrate-binding protein n=1 Tax=Spinactinospora alkalitolerans TaxID=687207 RepID=A0A852TSY1_9ACTN|nr:substrate-binding domain-containing protein [Spinactinospora alkalitolerans]NYE45224.1 simple sugar transport system substrate-binding protein [Spinactinospora alkalitolerans]
MIRNRRISIPFALTASAVLALTACSSEGGRQEQEAGGGGAADTPRLTIAMVTHAAPGDTFWDLVRSGAEAAAAKDNVELVYSSDPEAGNQANLVQNAVDQDVDGIAVTLAKPDALESVVGRAADAGIPVVGLNAGIDHWEDMGLLEYFGTDEHLAGTAFGERLNEVDAQKALCVIHEQGHVALETRCSSLAEEFDGESETLYVDGQNMPDVRSSITSKLQEDSEIDYVATLGAPFAMTAIDSVAEAGSEAAVATFDTNEELVGAIQSGDVEWAVDQQPYLQGYLAVDGLWLYSTNGNVSGGGTEPVLTGPSFVDQDNIDDVAAYAEKGTR